MSCVRQSQSLKLAKYTTADYRKVTVGVFQFKKTIKTISALNSTLKDLLIFMTRLKISTSINLYLTSLEMK